MHCIVREFQCPEINVVAAGVACVQQLQFGGFGEDAAVVRSEVADQRMENLPFVVPRVLVDDHTSGSEGIITERSAVASYCAAMLHRQADMKHASRRMKRTSGA